MAVDIGKRIKELREQRGMSQQDLADAIGMLDDEVSIARDKIGKIETGERGVSAIEESYLADALGVAPSALKRPVADEVLFRNGAPTDAAGEEAVRFFAEYVENVRVVELVKRSMPGAAAD